MNRFIQFLLVLFLVSPVGASKKKGPFFGPDTTWLRQELETLKVSKSFIDQALKNYDPKSFETVLKLNLIGFLSPPQHMDHVTDKAIKETAKFIKKNKTALKAAEKKYGVPAEVIASLIWIETKHGKDLGKFHILSVYLHLLQSDLPQNKSKMIELALEKNLETKKYTRRELRKIMGDRTKQRKKWAREQLLALNDMHAKKQVNLKTLKGSFAGAFGLPQFIPSSYKAYARSANPKRPPDLFRKDDAFMSVAHYLKKHGWKGKSEKNRIATLMKYNHSRDYAESILAISKKAIDPSQPTRGLSNVSK